MSEEFFSTESEEGLQRENFLKDYEAVCRKHNMIVSSCGCCESPWLVPVEKPEQITSHIIHLEEN